MRFDPTDEIQGDIYDDVVVAVSAMVDGADFGKGGGAGFEGALASMTRGRPLRSLGEDLASALDWGCDPEALARDAAAVLWEWSGAGVECQAMAPSLAAVLMELDDPSHCEVRGFGRYWEIVSRCCPGVFTGASLSRAGGCRCTNAYPGPSTDTVEGRAAAMAEAEAVLLLLWAESRLLSEPALDGSREGMEEALSRHGGWAAPASERYASMLVDPDLCALVATRVAGGGAAFEERLRREPFSAVVVEDVSGLFLKSVGRFPAIGAMHPDMPAPEVLLAGATAWGWRLACLHALRHGPHVDSGFTEARARAHDSFGDWEDAPGEPCGKAVETAWTSMRSVVRSVGEPRRAAAFGAPPGSSMARMLGELGSGGGEVDTVWGAARAVCAVFGALPASWLLRGVMPLNTFKRMFAALSEAGVKYARPSDPALLDEAGRATFLGRFDGREDELVDVPWVEGGAALPAEVRREEPKAKRKRRKAKAVKLPDEPFRLRGRDALNEFFNDSVVDVIRAREVYERLGIGFPEPFVLEGPPGCGKTFAVERLAEYLSLPTYRIGSSTVGSMFIHDTSMKIEKVFKEAAEDGGAVVIVDEMDAFMPDRGGMRSTDSHHIEEVSAFLKCIQTAAEKRILVVGMTNLLKNVDPAILRSGRMGTHIKVDMPSESEIKDVLDYELSKRPHGDIDTAAFAARFLDRPLSDVAGAVREAAMVAARRRADAVSPEDFAAGVERALSRKGAEERRPMGFAGGA